MINQLKEFKDVTPSDFEISPVWEFALDREQDGDQLVKPVFDLPARTLAVRFVGTQVRLANGQTIPACITNIHENDPHRTRHFLALTLYKGEWFDLARYHDVDVARNGPTGLANCLGLPVDEIFPISYDVRAYCVGNPNALMGTIEAEPKEKLSDKELRRLALSS